MDKIFLGLAVGLLSGLIILGTRPSLPSVHVSRPFSKTVSPAPQAQSRVRNIRAPPAQPQGWDLTERVPVTSLPPRNLETSHFEPEEDLRREDDAEYSLQFARAGESDAEIDAQYFYHDLNDTE